MVSWQVRTSSVWFYLANGCRTRNPAALTAGFHLFPALETRLRVAQLVNDWTDDCAFGAMMSLALRSEFRKLHFQMDLPTRSPEAVSRAGELRPLCNPADALEGVA